MIRIVFKVFVPTFAFVVSMSMASAQTEPPGSITTSGVVTYSDWMHVFRKDYKKVDWFWGEQGINYIIERAQLGRMNRLYWRVLNGGCSFAPVDLDSLNSGRRDITPQSQYFYDWPPYKPVYKIAAPLPYQVAFALVPPALDSTIVMNTSIHPLLDAGESFTIEFRCRLPHPPPPSSPASTRVSWFFTDPKTQTLVDVPFTSPDPTGELYTYFRLLVEPGKQVRLFTNHNDTEERTIPFAPLASAISGTGFRLHGSYTRLELDKLYLTRGLHSPSQLYPDEPWDVIADYGPLDGTWRDDWRNHWQAGDSIAVTTRTGDPIRQGDYLAPPFDTRSLIDRAVELTQSAKMQAYLWFSILEENHYGSGPLSLFTRRNPHLRERDLYGREWTARLSFAWPEVRNYKIGLIREFVTKTKPDGILLDFTRRGLMDPYHQRQNGTHIAMRDALGVSIFGYDQHSLDDFQKRHNYRPTAGNTSAAASANRDGTWIAFRNNHLTQFMRELRAAIPGTTVSIIVYATSSEESRQGDLIDWRVWAAEGLIDEIAFLIDRSKEGRPFVSPFGDQPRPLSLVQTRIASLKKELPDQFPVTAGLFAYRITASATQKIYEYARNAGANQLMWWETSSIEWADYRGSVWNEIRKQTTP